MTARWPRGALALVLLAGALLLPGAARADLDAGLAAYERGDYADAHRALSPLAEAGDAAAQAALGEMLRRGQGIAADGAAALAWFRRSAAQGNARGQVGLGRMHDRGFAGLPEDNAAAVRWYRLAAEQGDPVAQRSLAEHYSGGSGVARDPVLAAQFFRLAADQGDAPAQYRLGTLYESGLGVPRDEAEAVRWFRRAAAAGHADARAELRSRGLEAET